MGFMLVFVALMTAIILLLNVWPAVTPYLLGLAILSFLLTVVVFFISFLANPYRLGSIFKRI